MDNMFAWTIIRLGLAFSFFWTGFLILRDLEGWSKMLRNEWVMKIVPLTREQIMISVAAFDLILGVWLGTGFFLTIAVSLAALHLIQVLLVTGIMGAEYRDVGLLAAAIGLLIHSLV